MLLGGLFLGLVVSRVEWAAAPAPIAPPLPTIEAPSLYAEAERSREILEAQEGAPRPLLPSRIDGSHRASPSAVRVIDGDTIDYDGLRIRIADIDTPEVRGRCAHESELAARATARLRELLAGGAIELHRLPSGRDEDRYGRKLRIVTRDGRSVGDMLVAEGLARTWTGRREPWCA
jgi:micrococcal nuclease